MNHRQIALISSWGDHRTAGQGKKMSAHMDPAFVAAQGQRLLLMQLLLLDKVYEGAAEGGLAEETLGKTPSCSSPCACLMMRPEGWTCYSML